MNITKPTNPTYALCVSYIVTNKVVRYLLWDAVDTNFSSTIPTYQGQVIGKNFRLEVWNSGQTNNISGDEISFYTSKLGGVDYRWGTDSSLVITDGQNTSFACSTVGTVAVPTGGLIGRFDAATLALGDVHSWTSTLNVLDVLNWDGVNAPICEIYADLNNRQAVNMTTGLLAGVYANAFQSLFGKTVGNDGYIIVVCKTLDSSNGGLQCFNMSDVTPTGIFTINLVDESTRFYQLDGFPATVMTQPTENWCRIEKAGLGFTGQAQCRLTSIPNNFVMGGVTSTTNANSIYHLTLPACAFAVAEILIYTDIYTLNFQQLNYYLAQKYNSNVFLLPLVFPDNSTSVTN